jgi:hypothetical protein
MVHGRRTSSAAAEASVGGSLGCRSKYILCVSSIAQGKRDPSGSARYISEAKAIDKWQRDKSVTKRFMCIRYPTGTTVLCTLVSVTFRAQEGTLRAMSSTLTVVLNPGRTEHVHPCAVTKIANPLTWCVLQLQCTFSMATPPEQVSTI